jgi:hypothetical protein
MTHEEAIEAARLAISPMFDDDRLIPWSEAANRVINAYLEARGAVLCEKQHTWFDPERGVDLHAALPKEPSE